MKRLIFLALFGPLSAFAVENVIPAETPEESTLVPMEFSGHVILPVTHTTLEDEMDYRNLPKHFVELQVPGQTPVGIFSGGATPPLSGMQIWYEANVGNNCGGACSDGSSQSSWADQSGNGNNGTLTPSISSNCVSSVYHTNQINGMPAVTFNGNTTVGSETCFVLGNAGAPLAASNTITEILVTKNSAASSALALFTSGTQGASLVVDHEPGNAHQFSITNACTAVIGSTTDTYNNNWHQMNVTYNATTGAYAFRMDRAADGSGTNSFTISHGYFSLGVTFCGGSIGTLNGQIAEYILYNRVLSGAEITTVETYLNGKYAL